MKAKLFASALSIAAAALVLIGVGTWIGVGTLAPDSALAGSTVDPLAMMTAAKGLPTSHYDDYSLVFN